MKARRANTFIRSNAFTLIEVTVVLVLIGLLAAATTLSMGALRHKALVEDVIGQIEHQDQQWRGLARRHERLTLLRWQLDLGVISILDGGTQEVLGHPLTMPKGYRIERLLLPNVDIRAGEATATCSGAGRSQSYAMLLASPNEQRQWCLVAGMSGQMQRISDEREIEELFTQMASRPDFD